MNTIYFIILTALLFLFFFVLGKCLKKCKIWIYIDPIYYSLGAIGIIFLFSIESTDREIAKLKEEEKILVNEINYITTKKPILKDNIDLEFTSTMFNYLEIIAINSGSCSLEMGEIFTCLASIKMKPLIDNLIQIKNKEINSNEPDKVKIINICNYTDTFLLNIREKQILSTFTTNGLLEHYQLGLRSNLNSSEYEKLTDFIDSFKQRQLTKVEENKYLKNLSNSDKTKSMIIQETILSKLILKSFSGCLLYNDISNNEYIEWNNNLNSKIEEQRNKAILMEEMTKKQNEITHEKSFKLFIWPYIIILALSIKFGKGIAQIASK